MILPTIPKMILQHTNLFVLALGALAIITCIQHSLAANPGSIATGPRVEIKPDVPLVFFEAQTANKVLTCTTLGDKPGMFDQLRWSGPNRSDNWEELRRRHKVKETHRKGNALELEFQRPTPDDSGTYYCQGTYQKSDAYNASITVRVYNPIKIENCPDRQYVVEGAGSQKITCRITGDALSLEFYKDDAHLGSTNPRYKWDNDDSLLLLGSVNSSDAGTYRIEITSELTGNREKKEIQVEVHSKPEFPANSINEFSSVEGEQTELKCNVTGNPRPLVYWRDPKLRNSSSVGGYFVNPEEGTLLISKVNKNDDNGEFTCIARNNVGEASKKVLMVAMQRPNIYAFENKTFEEGTEAFLECRATGSPKPVFSIRRAGLNQVPYRMGDGFVTDITEDLEGGSAPGYVYRMKVKVDRSQFGLHYCNATNKAGSDEEVGQLAVKHRPDLSATPREQFFKLGDKNITLTCHIKAYPKPIVSWYNDMGQQILIAQEKFKASMDGQTHIVTMNPSLNVLANTDRYKCVAKNEIGEPAEVTIQVRYKTRPGMVDIVPLDFGPTMAKLQLAVPNDGGDRIRAYKYIAEGITMDNFNPIYNYPIDKHNETLIEALPTSSVYTIRNLLPYYRYKLSIKAVNDIGDGDWTETRIETRKATAPNPPIIIKPTLSSPSHLGITSEYQNGYLLRWSPPELDNGDPVTRYIIKLFKIKPEDSSVEPRDDEPLIIEQSNERPLNARIGPLETNSYYRINLQARNKYGDSEPASIIINTIANRPLMPEFNPQALTWLTEPSTPVLVGIVVLALLCLIIIDIIFCVCFQIGVSYSIRNCCCPAKANSVISDKTYT
uniref:Fasciclin-2 n=1 Tax=Aceria tosichella TaxID=561515 RepID=A0A6G1S7V9_9ACAR